MGREKEGEAGRGREEKRRAGVTPGSGNAPNCDVQWTHGPRCKVKGLQSLSAHRLVVPRISVYLLKLLTSLEVDPFFLFAGRARA